MQTEVKPVTEIISIHTEEEKEKLLQEFRQIPTGGHLGLNRTFESINLYTSWPGMKQEIENYVKHCETYKKNKITQNKTKLTQQITDTTEVIWQHCSLDIVGLLTQTLKNNKYLLTFQDELSKFKIAVAITQRDAVASFCRRNYPEIWNTPGDTN